MDLKVKTKTKNKTIIGEINNMATNMATVENKEVTLNLNYNYNPDSNSYLITDKDGKATFSDWKTLLSELKKLKTEYEESNSKMPIWVKGYTTFGDLLLSYASQGRKFRRKLARGAMKEIKKLIKKAEQNRFANTSPEKLDDNLRYLIARRYNLASYNNAPMGFYELLFLSMLDRGNLMEYAALNVGGAGNFAVGVDKYSKKRVLNVVDTLIEEYGDATPAGIIELKDLVEAQSTAFKFTIYDLIKDGGVKALLNEHIPFSILVADKVVCINEMKNFNGKSNPWEGPHYLFQYLNTYNGYDCDVLFGELDIVKVKKTVTDPQTGVESEIEVVTHDGLQNLRNHFGKAFKSCAELVPSMAIVHRAYANSIKTFDTDVNIIEDEEEEQIKIFLDLYESMSGLRKRQSMDELYKENFNRDDSYEGSETDDVKVLKAINRHINTESLKNAESKLSDLSVAVKFVRSQETHSHYAESHNITHAMIKKLIQSDSVRLLVSASLSALGPKFGIEEGSSQNVENLLSKFVEYFCGNNVFTIDKDGKGNVIGYEITDLEFLNALTKGGTDNFGGKGRLIYNSFMKAYRDMFTLIGLDDGDNPELTKKELKFVQAATGNNTCYWYESDTSGLVGKRGVLNGKKLPLTSIQHGKDIYNNWELIYFEDTSTNSGAGRKVKPMLKVDGYKATLELQEELFKQGEIDKKELINAKHNLGMVITHWEDMIDSGEIEIPKVVEDLLLKTV
jgi:hypothetical protein